MSSSKKGAAKKAAPKKAVRVPQGKTGQTVVKPTHDEQQAAAHTRLMNAEATRLELQNSELRQRMLREGLVVHEGNSVSGFVRIDTEELAKSAASAASFGKDISGDRPNGPSSPALTVDDAVEAMERCLEYTGELVDQLDKVLAPLLRPVINGEGADRPMPEIVSSDLARKLRGHCGRNANVNGRLRLLLENLDLRT